ncbi:MAG: glycoside hydrolase [Planctomycetales bacterium]|nr:glycoside hydrolase [Planctomycetales bacterium]
MRTHVAMFWISSLALTLLLAPAMRADAAWQNHQITVGDGHGGAVAYPALKQEIPVPGYEYNMPFGLAQMNNGQVALVGSLEVGSTTRPYISFSSDGGGSWSARQWIPSGSGGIDTRPMMFTYLGGGNLSYVVGHQVFTSSDYGQTWPSSASYSYTLGGSGNFAIEGNAAVDRDTNGNAVRVMEVGYSYGSAFPYTGKFGYSTDCGRTWQGQVEPPAWTYDVVYNGQTYRRGVSEGSVVRAANGSLVAALRMDTLPQYPSGSTWLSGTGVSISQDNGQTWSAITRLYTAGRMHADLQRLGNGDLVMTMIVRNDIRTGVGLDSHNKGADALVSHDNGLTWNLDQRITLDAFEFYNPNDPYAGNCGHLASTILNDGSVLTAYGKYQNGSAVLIKWNPTALPEPSTWAMLSAGGLALGAKRCRRLWLARWPASVVRGRFFPFSPRSGRR